MEKTTAKSEHQYWSVELARGIAAAMVIVAHYAPVVGFKTHLVNFTYTGVDLFFVITGFVFAPQILGSMPSVKDYFFRRTFRIYPLYTAAILGYIGIRAMNGQEARFLLEHLTFTHTLYSKEIAFYYNPAFWSLPPEVEFYLLLPILNRLLASIRGFFILLGCALALHLAISASYSGDGSVNVPVVASLHIPGLLIEFLLGTLVWIAWKQWPHRRIAWACGALGLVGWLTTAMVFEKSLLAPNHFSDLFRNNIGLMAACAYALIICAMLQLEKGPHRRLKSAAAFLGNMSFAAYLLHNVTLSLMQHLFPKQSPSTVIAASLALLVPLCLLLHYAVEAPARRLGRRLGGHGAPSGQALTQSNVETRA